MAGLILVIGATGTVGSEVVARLLRRGEKVRAATRRPQAQDHAPVDAPYVEFDLDRPETFAKSLDGVDRVFLIARPGDEQADRTAIPFVEQARRQGVRHVVDLSAMGAEQLESMALRKVERHLEGSGIEFTHLRPNWFMQIFTTGPLHTAIRETGQFHLPAGAARISFVDARDIAEVAAIALTEHGHAGQAYTLTGNQALDHFEVAQIISQASAKTLQYVALDDETARAAIASSGLSAERVERLIGFYRLVRQGFSAPVALDVERVLGRPPTSFAQFAKEYADRWS